MEVCARYDRKYLVRLFPGQERSSAVPAKHGLPRADTIDDLRGAVYYRVNVDTGRVRGPYSWWRPAAGQTPWRFLAFPAGRGQIDPRDLTERELGWIESTLWRAVPPQG